MNIFLQITVKAAKLWYKKDASGMAAVVSYYMLFAVIPLLLLTVFTTSFLYGKDIVVATFDNWGKILGPEMLSLLHEGVQNLEMITSEFSIPVLGLLFFSGMTIVMFNTFTKGLHSLWGVSHRGIKGWLQKTFRSITFIFVFEGYLLFLIGLNIVLSSATGVLGGFELFVIRSIFFIATTTILFSLLYSILPRLHPLLRERLLGGLVASILFLVAKSFVSFYVTATPIPGLFGTAGLVLVLLIWVYVTCSIIYYGAAFAYVLNQKKFE